MKGGIGRWPLLEMWRFNGGLARVMGMGGVYKGDGMGFGGVAEMTMNDY